VVLPCLKVPDQVHQPLVIKLLCSFHDTFILLAEIRPNEIEFIYDLLMIFMLVHAIFLALYAVVTSPMALKFRATAQVAYIVYLGSTTCTHLRAIKCAPIL